jgi:hypothetical protein
VQRFVGASTAAEVFLRSAEPEAEQTTTHEQSVHDDPEQPLGRHRLFHALVVMGSALAVGCGGLSDEQRQQANGARPADGAGGGGATGTSSGVGPSGGLAGVASGIGGLSLSSGGTTGDGIGGVVITLPPSDDGGMAGAPTLNCPTEQWSCEGTLRFTCYGRNYVLSPDGVSPANCVCDDALPKSAEDCSPDRSFVCLAATVDMNNEPLDHPVPFECGCVAAQPNCDLTCGTAYGDDSRCITASTPADADLCDCAYIVLK